MPPKKRKVASKTNGETASHVKAARAARAARADPHDAPPRDESSESMTGTRVWGAFGRCQLLLREHHVFVRYTCMRSLFVCFMSCVHALRLL